MDEVTERTSSVLSLTFTDEFRAPVTPAAGTYRIDDEETGLSIRAATPFTPGGNTHDLDISAEENRCLGGMEYEVRRVTVEYTFGSNPVRNGKVEYLYAVRNLRFVS